jgi:hypothetical protein
MVKISDDELIDTFYNLIQVDENGNPFIEYAKSINSPELSKHIIDAVFARYYENS